MKKLGIFFISLLTLGLVSCEEDSFNRGIEQTNPQEALMSYDGLTVDWGEATQAGQLNIADYEGKTIPVIKTVATENLPEGATISYKMQIATNEAYTDALTLDVVNGAVDAKAWDDAFRKLLGRAPFAKDNYIRFAAYTNIGKQVVRLGGEDIWYAAKKIVVTPIDLGIEIEENYYLLGTINGWDVATAVPFTHSDKNQYDDPIFTLTFEVSEAQAADGWWFKIVPQSTFATGTWQDADNSQWGVEENGSCADIDTEGILVPKKDGVDPGAACLKQAGQWMLTIDMLNGTYKISMAIEALYTPGDSNGWNQGASQILYTNDYKNYQGLAYLTTGGFKFTTAPDWNHTNLGNSGVEGVLSTDPGAGNLEVAENGLYWCTVNMTELTYNTAKVNTLGVIGDFNGWAQSVALTPSADFLVWTGEVTFSAAGGWKFRANDDWAINFGGASLDELNFNDGTNLSVAEAGTYVITFDARTVPYKATMTKK